METTVQTAQDLGLLSEEYEKIKEVMGRTPNFTELAAYSGMWSEHCSYKNSIIWLKKLPKDSPRMLAKAGEENAGLVDIGNGLACAFKIESHNHPSALEPYQGAATGVGGINRDIFTMGARPIAQMNSLRFGNLDLDRTKHLIKGVVKGIGDYGNAFGVPTVGGEVFFDDSFNTNPLVNAFSAGIVKTGLVASAIAKGAGNPVFIVGSATGKDGIHGASFASKNLTENSMDDLPAVQVGDPFQEKLLLEATLEVIATGNVVGIQDMGAAGIICSTSEMSAKGEHGMEINLDKVPLRQENMQAFEILLSESQERMLVVGKKGSEQAIIDIFKKWDLNCVQIGKVIEGERLKFYKNGQLEAELNADSLVLGGGAPVYEREWKEPDYAQANLEFNVEQVPVPESLEEYQKIIRYLLSHPNITSKRWVYEQYDSMVGTVNGSTNRPSDAAVAHVKESTKSLVMSVDCNSRYVRANPEIGTMIAVCEAARNVVCTGGVPVAITNCLNFGNPYNPEVYWQFVGAIKGMKVACEKLETPVTGGNVSFYNQSAEVSKGQGTVDNAVFPTPTIGMLGLLEDRSLHTTLDFKQEGDLIYLIGSVKNDLASSEYLYSYHQVKNSPTPAFDLEEEYQVQQVTRQLIEKKLVQSVHDVSDGGLWVALAESAMPNALGFAIVSDSQRIPEVHNIRKDAFLFGENQSRVMVSVSMDKQSEFESFLNTQEVAWADIGIVNEENFIVDGEVWMTSAEAQELYHTSLEKRLNGL